MKGKLLIILLIGFGFAAGAFAQSGSESQPPVLNLTGDPDIEEEPELTMIEFEETNFDFGVIKQGDVVKHTFVFKNIGDHPAIIENVKPSCGCTKLSAPDAPIQPGETGEIEIQFDSAGKLGKQHKNVTVVYNGNPRFEQVFFEGDITPNADPANSDHEEHDHSGHDHSGHDH